MNKYGLNSKTESGKRLAGTICRIMSMCFFCIILIAGVRAYGRRSILTHSGSISGGYTLTQYYDITGGQASFYTLTDNAGHLIVIDGGWADNAEYVRQTIRYYGNHVDLWILTHPHQDHIGAFNEIYANPDGITIDQIYDSPVDYDTVKNQEKWDDITVFEKYLELTANAGNVTHLGRGDEFTALGLHFQVFNSYDENVTRVSDDITNDSSLVFKVSSTSGSVSVLFMGDIKYQMEDTLENLYGSQLDADYIQAGHHGNWSMSFEFYEAHAKKGILMDAPSWITTDSTYPAYELVNEIKSHGLDLYDHSTAPNRIALN
jgi:beta-lactamase superfamily II metal-dependent hydrolase